MALDPTLLVGLKALESYLDDMVIAGGWVPYLFAAHEQPSAEAVVELDSDRRLHSLLRTGHAVR